MRGPDEDQILEQAFTRELQHLDKENKKLEEEIKEIDGLIEDGDKRA